MIGLPAFLRRKPKSVQPPGAAADEKAPPASNQAKPPHFAGAAGEKTQDLLAGHDGERIGFRMPLEE
jgi:hypothetical protein